MVDPSSTTTTTAKGRFEVDTSGVDKGAQVVVRQATVMETAFNRAGAAAAGLSASAGSSLKQLASYFDGAKARAEAFANTDLGKISKGLEDAATSAGALLGTLGAAGVVKAGLDAALSIQKANAQMTIYSGSAKQAAIYTKQMSDYAAKTGQGINSLRTASAAVLPIIKGTNADLGTTLSLVQRLSVLNPEQGVEGAAFALRELSAGQYTSLANRFNISRTELEKIVKDSKGSITATLSGLDKMIDKIGVTQEQFNALNTNGTTAFARLDSAVQEALGTAFEPFLDKVVIPLVNGLTTFITQIQQTSPALLQVASIFAIAATAAAPLLIVISQLITAYKTIKTVTAGLDLAKALGGGGGLATAGVTVGALVAGTKLGVSLVSDLAQSGVGDKNSDFQRIRNGEKTEDVLGERAKQALVVIVAVIVKAVEGVAIVLVGGANIIKQAFELIASVLQLGVAYFKEGFGAIQIALGNVVIGLSDFLAKIPGQEGFANTVGQQGIAILQAGIDTDNSGKADEAQSKARLALGFDSEDFKKQLKGVDDTFQGVMDTVVGGLTGLLFPSLTKVADAVPDAVDKFNELRRVLANAQADFVATADAIKKANAEAKEKTKLEQETRQIEDGRQRFDQALSDSRRDADRLKSASRATAAFYKSLAENAAALRDELKTAEADEMVQKLEALAAFHEQEEQRTQDHEDRLKEIEDRTRLAVQNAAAKLDANAVFEALTQGAQDVGKEDSSFNTATARNKAALDKQLADLDANLKKQSDAKTADFKKQLIAEQANRTQADKEKLEDEKLQDDREKEDRDRANDRKNQDRVRADNLEAAALKKKTDDLVTALATQTGLNKRLVEGITNSLVDSGNKVINFVNLVNAQISKLGDGSGSSTATGGSSTKTYPTKFATGGNAPLNKAIEVNENRRMESAMIANGRQLALFSSPARILSASQTSSLLGGAGGGGMSLNIGSIAQSFGDIGSHSEGRIMELFKQAMWSVLQEAKAKT